MTLLGESDVTERKFKIKNLRKIIISIFLIKN
jgi:hypothetical protein